MDVLLAIWEVLDLPIVIFLLLNFFLVTASLLVYAERKVSAFIQERSGPNRVGPAGLFQSFADVFKLMFKENIVPAQGNPFIHSLAPVLMVVIAMSTGALIPWAKTPAGDALAVADIGVGLLVVLAMTSVTVYGVTLAGWSSNSKYSLLGGLRSSAQMISYEVSIGFILVCVVLWAGSWNLTEIVEAQRGHGFGIVNGFYFNLLLFPMWVVFFISSLAETQRVPFDLTEAESELVAGYQTEYSSMAFALFWLGEYANILLMCALNTLLFFGGWLPPVDWAPLYWVPGIIWFLLKTLFFFFMFSWVMATVPRYRYDQLMRLGWKVFLPMSLIFVFVISGYLMATGHFGTPA